MALPVREQFKYWGVAAAIFFLLLFALGDQLLPFFLRKGLIEFHHVLNQHTIVELGEPCSDLAGFYSGYSKQGIKGGQE